MRSIETKNKFNFLVIIEIDKIDKMKRIENFLEKLNAKYSIGRINNSD